MIDACDSCLRRSLLIAHLAPRIAGLLGGRVRRVSGLLALPEEELLAAAGGRGLDAALSFLEDVDVDAERELLVAGGFMVLCGHTGAYPPLLRELPDPPSALFALGRDETFAALEEEPAVAVVGTRDPSSYGLEVAHSIGRGLGASGVAVVSGLALGIDATVHRGCIAAGGIPVAVVACGPDVIYPRRHAALHEQVRQTGVVLSELPPGTQPYRWSFPARNRIMAGLARLTLVVEAADPSGSLITADFAKDLGRSVAAVPGRVTSRLAAGTNNLLMEGAAPVRGTEDILDELFGVGMRSLREPAKPRRPPDDEALRATLEAAESFESVEEIAARTGRTAAETRACLGRLESEGYLVRRDLGGWERAAS